MASPPNPDSTFAVRLRQARLQLGISQAELGRRAGLEPEVASPRVNQYERGSAEPQHATAKRLAKVLGIPTAFLYAEDPQLAKLLLAWAGMTLRERRELLRSIAGTPTPARTATKKSAPQPPARAARPGTKAAASKAPAKRKRTR